MAEGQPTVEYRDIPGHPGYRVGSDGSVWSCWKRIGTYGGRGTKCVIGTTWKRMKLKVGRRGYQLVTLATDRKMYAVHRLVLEAFVGPRPPGMQARHFPDRDPANNRLDNLSWATAKVNQGDRLLHGTDNRGQRSGRTKLTPENVRSIRADHAAGGVTLDDIARKHGITRSAVAHIVKRRCWAHVT